MAASSDTLSTSSAAVAPFRHATLAASSVGDGVDSGFLIKPDIVLSKKPVSNKNWSTWHEEENGEVLLPLEVF